MPRVQHVNRFFDSCFSFCFVLLVCVCVLCALHGRLTAIDGLEGLTGLSELYLSHNVIENAHGLDSQVLVLGSPLRCTAVSMLIWGR